MATTKKPTGLSAFKNTQTAGIESVNLRGDQSLLGYDKTTPTASSSLDRLPGSMVTGRTMPVQIRKRPGCDYTKERQPQTSLPKKHASAEASSDKPSTDYDTGWMGDLPSPSALLERTCEKLGDPPEQASIDHGSSWPLDLSNLSAPICQTDKASEDCGNCSLGGSDSLLLGNHESEIEAAMIGLDDSVIMQKNSQVQTAICPTRSQADTIHLISPLPDVSTSGLYPGLTGKGDSSDTSRLFFSVESPENEADIKQKRKPDVSDTVDGLSQSVPVNKRLRVDDGHDQSRRRSSSVLTQTLSSRATVKPGQPAWVYDIDPAFIMEWQDIVDFI